MKKQILLLSILLPFLNSCASEESMSDLTDRVFGLAETQVRIMAAEMGPMDSPRTFEDGQLVKDTYRWWCSGFFPGVLWFTYEYTGNEDYKTLAEKETAKIEPVKHVRYHHDVGFMINCSFGHQYRLTGDQHALEVLRTAAESLTGSFAEEVGCIKSWPFVKEGFSWVYPVIIDNMMNLELLMSVGNMDNNEWLRHVAVSHADRTMANHFREDYTCFHLVDYVPGTGEVNKKITVQGLADSSAWARGQAWTVYGYTMCYRETGDEKYLAHAEHIANYIMNAVQTEDKIPYWDYHDTAIPDVPRDASAAAVTASALLELSTLTKDADKAKAYVAYAEDILLSLSLLFFIFYLSPTIFTCSCVFS